MAPTTGDLADLEAKAAAGEWFSRADVERVLASVDLISVGMLGDAARRHLSGDAITFCRVCEVSESVSPPDRGDAGEVRIVAAPASVDEACDRVRRARAFASGVPLTGFSAADLLDLCGHDHLALADCAARLRAEGLESVAECPLDRLGATEQAVEVVRALLGGGLGVWRLTVDHAPVGRRLDLIEGAAAVQRETGAVRAFAPLPRLDAAHAASTGYDDVRAVAVARLVCREVPSIQVDWPLYGPKLAQVALTYGANDVDGIAAVDTGQLGARRSPVEDINRQIRAAGGTPIERNGRYERLS